MLPSNNKVNKTHPYVVTALVVLASFFFLVQIVGDKILTRDESTSTPVGSRQMSVLGPPDMLNLNDEFFSSPFMFDSGLMAMKQEMDRHRDMMLKSLSSPSSLRFDKTFEPQYNVKEKDDEIAFTVSVPDIPLKDIEIEILDGRVLHISGTKRVEHNGAVAVTSFDKRFALGRNLDQDNISATLKRGELTVETPKWKEIEGEKKVMKIPIKEEL
eukprot:CAMPEP_0178712966 /NCGR_PEP_ID=MMETSP0699-20121125/19163_1 /TAXON_ID=265572 /ORGANISM="Extubocellulus spinifer, Strain CCMP396" /LENGTH=213 /DNA_ID=CAMNT_0020361751 /DNA_START=89 /DNA_END=730 /DNA_ORIENTATION=+